MEFREFRAKTVNDAITDALIAFEATSDMIEYEVIEEGSTGLLGLFSKDAIIRARKKEDLMIEEEEIFDIKAELNDVAHSVRDTAKKNYEKKAPQKAEKKAAVKPAAEKKTPEKNSPEHRTVEKPVEKKPLYEEVAVQEPKTERKPKGPAREIDETVVKEVLHVIFEKLGIQAETKITVDQEERVVNIEVDGDDTGDIIGKRGQTLDAIQYLASIIINKKQDSYYRVKLDTNNYRERRQKTLENLAKNVASKVKKTRRKVALEPMNPYERRVIHSYLQSDKFVTTKSEGEEPNRRVVVYYKKS